MIIYAYKSNDMTVIFSTKLPDDDTPYIALDSWPSFSNEEYYDIDYEAGKLISQSIAPLHEEGASDVSELDMLEIINSI